MWLFCIGFWLGDVFLKEQWLLVVLRLLVVFSLHFVCVAIIRVNDGSFSYAYVECLFMFWLRPAPQDVHSKLVGLYMFVL